MYHTLYYILFGHISPINIDYFHFMIYRYQNAVMKNTRPENIHIATIHMWIINQKTIISSLRRRYNP